MAFPPAFCLVLALRRLVLLFLLDVPSYLVSGPIELHFNCQLNSNGAPAPTFTLCDARLGLTSQRAAPHNQPRFKGQYKVEFQHIQVADFLEKQAKWMSYSSTDASSPTEVDAFNVVRPMDKKAAQKLKAEELKTKGVGDDKNGGDKITVFLAGLQQSQSRMSSFFGKMSEFMGSIVQEREEKREEELPPEIRKELMVQKARIEIAKWRREADRLEKEQLEPHASKRPCQSLGTKGKEQLKPHAIAHPRQSLETTATCESDSSDSHVDIERICDELVGLRKKAPHEIVGTHIDFMKPDEDEPDGFDLAIRNCDIFNRANAEILKDRGFF